MEKQLDLKRKLKFKSEDLDKQGDNMPGTMMKRPMMKKGGKALKKVKPNQKGLKKLPKKVRNKMGYMKDGRRAK